MIAQLFVSPDKFFKDAVLDKKFSLKTPILIILIFCAIYGLIAINTLPLQQAQQNVFLYIGYALGLVSVPISIVFTWFLISGIFFTISHFLGGKNDFRLLFNFTSFGFIPAIFNLIFMYVMGAVLEINPDSWIFSFVGVLFMLWSANIWVFAVKHARSLTTRNAIITVAIPIVILMGYQMYQMMVI